LNLREQRELWSAEEEERRGWRAADGGFKDAVTGGEVARREEAGVGRGGLSGLC